jgi:hypothetical protein
MHRPKQNLDYVENTKVKYKQYAGELKGFTLGQRREGVIIAQVNT